MPRATVPTRERLVNAAKQLFHQQGLYQTTLADIAQAADVPLGNVYYHFRTKDALVDVVAADHALTLQHDFAAYEQDPNPRERLKGLLRTGHANIAGLVAHGCPYAGLCQDLEKGAHAAPSETARLFSLYLDWSTAQFRLLGSGDRAIELAVDLIAAIQGAYLLAHTLHAPDLLKHKLERLEGWLDTL